MSSEKSPEDGAGSQPTTVSSLTPLTTANLAAHEKPLAGDPSKKQDSSMERWLAYTGNDYTQPREASDWDQLVAREPMAKDIEIAIRDGNKAGADKTS
jgi:hypothetical protein